MEIRPEQPGDHDGIHAVHVESFPDETEAKLVDALRAAGNLTVSLVAEEQGRVIGHVAFSPVAVPGVSDAVGLAPVAVLVEFRRRGVADRLIREGMTICRGQGRSLVVVLGDPEYYGRFGFEVASARGLRDEYGGGDAFQIVELRAGAVPSGGGTVRYAPEFGAFDQGHE